MTKHVVERRRHKRIYFSQKEYIFAALKISEDDPEQIRARVLNLSEGGLFISADTSQAALMGLNEGDQLTITEITGTDPEMRIDEIKMEIRWLVQNKFLSHVGFGCEFIEVTEGTKAQIIQIVNSWEE
jgi:c-di-GMP-binding flagellar brake protein YcgR